MKKLFLVFVSALIWVTLGFGQGRGQGPQGQARGQYQFDTDSLQLDDVVFQARLDPVEKVCHIDTPLIFTTKAPNSGRMKTTRTEFDANCKLRVVEKTEGPAEPRKERAGIFQPMPKPPLAQLAALGGSAGLKDLLRPRLRPVVWQGGTVTSVTSLYDIAFFWARVAQKTGTLNYSCCDYPHPLGFPPYIMTTGFHQSCEIPYFFFSTNYSVISCPAETDIWGAYYGSYAIRSQWGTFRYTGPAAYREFQLYEGTKATANQSVGTSECLHGISGSAGMTTGMAVNCIKNGMYVY